MFKKNLFILTIGTVFTKVLQYFLVPLLTFFLSKEDYGVIDLISTTINLLIPITTLSIIEAVYRFGADENEDKGKILINGLILWAAGCFLCLPIFMFVNSYFNYSKIILFLYLCSLSLFNILSYYLKAQNKTGLYTISSVVFGIATSVLAILFVCVFKRGMQGYYIAFVVGTIASIVLVLIFIKPFKVLAHSKIDFVLLKRMIKYSAPLVLNNISWWIISASDKYLTLWSIGTEANGILAVVHKIPSIISVFSTIFLSAFQLSAFTEYDFTKEQNKKVSESYSKILNSLNFILICCTLGICLLIKPFTIYFVDKDFFESYLYIPIYALSSVMHCLSGFYGSIFSVNKKNLPNTISSLIGAFTNLVLGYLFMFVLKIGLYGAALSTLISYSIVLIYRLIFTKRIITIGIQSKIIVSFLIACIAVGVNSFGLNFYIVVSINCISLLLVFFLNIPITKSFIRFLFKRKIN